MEQQRLTISNLLIMPEHINGLIFDCDGTIVDTMPLHYQAWIAALKEYGCEFPESLFYEMAGIPTIRILEIFNEKYGYGLPVLEAAQRKESLAEGLIPQALAIAPVVEVIHRYAGKLPMAVASGTTRHLCSTVLSRLGLAELFQAIVTAEDVEHGKPAPDIFLEAARRIGVHPAECLVYEDADLGLQAARAAGMSAVDIRPILKRLSTVPALNPHTAKSEPL